VEQIEPVAVLLEKYLIFLVIGAVMFVIARSVIVTTVLSEGREDIADPSRVGESFFYVNLIPGLKVRGCGIQDSKFQISKSGLRTQGALTRRAGARRLMRARAPAVPVYRAVEIRPP
jgi:hypothetical protein